MAGLVRQHGCFAAGEDANRCLKKLYVHSRTRAFIAEEAPVKNSSVISAVAGDQGSSVQKQRVHQSSVCRIQHQRDLYALVSEMAGREQKDREVIGAPYRE